MSEHHELLEQRIVNYISERVGASAATVAESDGLFSEGLLDSMAVMDLVSFVEREAGVRFSTTDISLENLDSVGNLMRFVGARSARQ
jgi:acyl carrier protein